MLSNCGTLGTDGGCGLMVQVLQNPRGVMQIPCPLPLLLLEASQIARAILVSV